MPERRLLLLSGPNLQLLGTREPEVYGHETLEDHVATARETATCHGYELEHLQSNHEGDLVDAIGGARGVYDGIVVNPGALTHYAWSLHDAVAAFGGPVVELHLSNPAARERFRQRSVIAPVAAGTIAGFGALGYRLAVEAVVAVVERQR
jgi:3-dehydroquinate dehydratase-2